ncbi:MAG: hypothetical protein RL685_65 [Pseudomonadota bacterium]|jgi:polyketide synthase PksN
MEQRNVDAVAAVVAQEAAAALGEDVRELALDANLGDIGFESIALTDLATKLSARFGVQLSPAIFFEFESITEVAKFLCREYGDAASAVVSSGRASSAPMAAPPAASSKQLPVSLAQRPSAPELRAPISPRAVWPLERTTDATLTCWDSPEALVPTEPSAAPACDLVHLRDPSPASCDEIAIVGMACRFPGAGDVDAFWESLIGGTDAMGEVPADRWDWRQFSAPDGQNHTRWAACMDGVWRFDAEFFGISPREAEHMDPQQRLLLQSAWCAIEDAGYKDLRGTNTGFFVGVSTNDYRTVLSESSEAISPYTTTGNFHSILVNRISYLLDLRGPSEPVDTACSSSLVALARAVSALRNGECTAALVGGVNALLHPDVFVSFGKAGMLSKNGRCMPFAAGADGYVRGEGVGVILIKPLAEALRQNDHVYGVIRGCAVNHTGRGRSMTTPNPVSQAEVIRQAWGRTNVDPRSIQYIEMHGTGTPLGDPIEVRGLNRALGAMAQAQGVELQPKSCHVGSVKGHIGHLEAAAGMAGVLKILLALDRETMPRQLHLEVINPALELDAGPLALCETNREWLRGEPGTPRRAGVSSFGFGGVNAHVAIEEYTGGGDEISSSKGREIIVLSARTEPDLRGRATQLANYLKTREGLLGPQELARIAQTLRIGRLQMEVRLALVAEDIPSLSLGLAAYLEGTSPIGSGPIGIWHSDSRQSSDVRDLFKNPSVVVDLVDSICRSDDWDSLAALWVKGVDIDWEACEVDARRLRRIPLPGYPFEGLEYRVRRRSRERQQHEALGANPFGPALRLGSWVVATGNAETGTCDHWVNEKPVVAGAAQLMLCAAAIGRRADPASLELRDIRWLSPVPWSEAHELMVQVAEEGGGYRFFSEGSSASGERARGVSGHASIHARQGVTFEAPVVPSMSLSAEAFYARLAEGGLSYGPAFRCVKEGGIDGEVIVVRLTPDQQRSPSIGTRGALLDGALQAVALLVLDLGLISGGAPVPAAAAELVIHGDLDQADRAVARVVSARVGAPLIDVALLDAAGGLLAAFKGLRIATLSGEAQATANVAIRKLSWEPLVEPQAPPTVPARVMLLGELGKVRDVLSAELGDSLVMDAEADGGASLFEPEDGSALGSWVQRHCGEAASVLVYCAWSSSNSDLGQHGEATALRIVATLRALWQAQVRRLEIVYCSGGGPGTAGIAAGAAALLRAAAQESPKLCWRSLQPISISSDEAIVRDFRQRLGTVGEIRDDGEQVWRATWDDEPARQSTPALRPGGVYLISGGLGGVGTQIARRLLRDYFARVILIGRRPVTTETEALLRELGDGHVIYRSVDVTDAMATRNLVQDVLQEYGELNGVFHCAGVLHDALIPELSSDRVRAALAPKVIGCVSLAEATLDAALDFFVGFSSLAATRGNEGQAAYAFANGFSSGYLLERGSSTGVGHTARTLSIAWPLLVGQGMSNSQGLLQRYRARWGHTDLPMDRAVQLLFGLLGQGGALEVVAGAEQVGAARESAEGSSSALRTGADWSSAKGSGRSQGTLPPAAEVALGASNDTNGSTPRGHEELLAYVRRCAAEILGVRAEGLATGLTFRDLGIDSIAYSELALKFHVDLGVRVGPMMFYEYPTIEAVARQLREELQKEFVSPHPQKAHSTNGRDFHVDS